MTTSTLDLPPLGIDRIPAKDLIGWCVQFRVWAYGYAGQPTPAWHLRENLDCAIQHYRIHGRLWDRTGGLGRRYGAPGEPLPPTPAQREAQAFEEYEDHEQEQRRRATDPDYDYTQDWVYDL